MFGIFNKQIACIYKEFCAPLLVIRGCVSTLYDRASGENDVERMG